MDKSNNDDLFSASLDSIDSSRRVDKYQRFKNDFQRECTATLDNAQEWIKAELPMVTDYIDAAAVKDELKLPETSGKTSARRKHLLSALLFEKSLRESIENNHADKAAVLAIHMCNHMWQAKVEQHGSLPTAVSLASSMVESPNNTALETQNDSRAKILTTLIEKSEKLQRDSQLQSQVKSKVQIKPNESAVNNNNTPASKNTLPDQAAKKPAATSRKRDLWAQEDGKAKHNNFSSSTKKGKPKKKSAGVFAKVKTRLPLMRKNKVNKTQPIENTSNDSLLENPNRSSIMVNPGFSDSIDDSLIQARSDFSDKSNESGVTVHKVLKDRVHEKQAPGSNTIIMKLASSSGKRSGAKLSIPEQCQQAINILTQQFPGYDMVAVRNMAAQKVGVSPQYIENLNILPEQL